MMLLSEEEISKARENRKRLESIANAVGVAFEPDNYRLVHALETLAYEQKKQAPSSPRSTAESRSSTVQETPDEGDRVVAVLRERGILPAISAVHDPRIARPAGTGDLGDQVVAILEAQGVGSHG